MKKWICLILACLALLGVVGCSDSAQETQNTNAEGFSLTNSILGEDYLFTYPEVPQRIVSLSSPATEMLLALGLEESIVGYAMQDNEIPVQYKTAFDSLHCITKDWTVSKEMILALEPDFLMFWNGSADYDYEFLNTNDISTYTMTSDIGGAKIESVYDDFSNMGKIFGKEDRAAEIIAAMKEKIDPVAARTKELTPVSVAYVDAYSTEEAVFTAGDALVADIFRTAGAFAGAILSSVLVFLLSGASGRVSATKLILSGVAVSSLFSAVTNLLIFLQSNEKKLSAVLFWMTGSFASVTWGNVLPVLL